MNTETAFCVVKTTFDIPRQRVLDLLCSALEGGSNYWIGSIKPHYAKGLTAADFKEGGKLQDPHSYYHPYQLIPTVDGCALDIKTDDDDTKEYTLNCHNLRDGMQRLANYPARHHWRNFIEEDDDAETGDVYLQLCLFGEVVYS